MALHQRSGPRRATALVLLAVAVVAVLVQHRYGDGHRHGCTPPSSSSPSPMIQPPSSFASSLVFVDAASAASVAASSSSSSGSSSGSSSSSSLSSSAPSSNLLLDESIMYWVLFPILLVMILQGVLRQYVSVLLRDDKAPPSLDSLATGSLMRRSQRFRTTCSYIPSASVRMRRKWLGTILSSSTEYLQTYGDASLAPPGSSGSNGGGGNDGDSSDDKKSGGDDSSSSSAAAAPGGDPFAMVNMMKQNMAMIVPNMLLMGWISYFFSGFVIAKLPFSLSDRFRMMVQRGLALQTLDVSYVSSLSWYFLTLMGLRGLFSLLLGADSSAVDNPEMIAASMAMPMAGGGMPGMPGMGGPAAPGSAAQQAEIAKLFSTEKNEVDIINPSFIVPLAEKRLVAMMMTGIAAK